MSYIETLVKCCDEQLRIGRTYKGDYTCSFDCCDERGDGVLIGHCGFGATAEEAALDYINQIKGKRLVFDAHSVCEREMYFAFIEEQNSHHYLAKHC